MKTLTDEVTILKYRMENGEDPLQIAVELPRVLAEQHLDRDCGHCGAKAGRPCETPHKAPRERVHVARAAE